MFQVFQVLTPLLIWGSFSENCQAPEPVLEQNGSSLPSVLYITVPRVAHGTPDQVRCSGRYDASRYHETEREMEKEVTNKLTNLDEVHPSRFFEPARGSRSTRSCQTFLEIPQPAHFNHYFQVVFFFWLFDGCNDIIHDLPLRYSMIFQCVLNAL